MKKVIKESSIRSKYMAIFIGVMVLAMLCAMSLATIASLFFDRTPAPQGAIQFMVRILVFMLPIGAIFTYFATKFVAEPVKKLSIAAEKVAKGDFSVSVAPRRNANDELTRLTDDFNTMVRELSKNEYLHRDFVSNVSHEFKTPLAAIRGYTEMLSLPEVTDEKRLEYAEIITRQVDRLSRLSTDLLRLSELEQVGTIINHDKFSLSEQLRDAVIMLSASWEEKEIEIDFESDEIIIKGDKALLYQVWINVLSNAIKYTPKNGNITISANTSDSLVNIIITDSGKGMAKEQAERIFERFYKADKSRTSDSTGLGMSIVKRIIELHDGKISVISTEGVGTSIEISLNRLI